MAYMYNSNVMDVVPAPPPRRINVPTIRIRDISPNSHDGYANYMKSLNQSHHHKHCDVLYPDYTSDFCKTVVDTNKELIQISARIAELRKQKKDLQESVVDKIEKRWYPKKYKTHKALEETEHRIKQKAIVLQAQLNLDDMDRRDLIYTSRKPITVLKEEAEITEDLKNAIRGRTASQIAAALLADSDRHLKEMKQEDERRHMRATSESRCIKRTTRVEMVDDRLIDHLDSSVSSKLCDMKRELANFSQKTEDLYLDSRLSKIGQLMVKYRVPHIPHTIRSRNYGPTPCPLCHKAI